MYASKSVSMGFDHSYQIKVINVEIHQSKFEKKNYNRRIV